MTRDERLAALQHLLYMGLSLCAGLIMTMYGLTIEAGYFLLRLVVMFAIPAIGYKVTTRERKG